MKKPIIIVSGATATGKTKTSITIAQEMKRLGHDVEIINFDSLLFYKELNIGTAKPTEEEMAGIPHWLVSNRSIKEPMNAADYIKLCTPIIEDLHKNKKIPLLTGGSAFYIRALIKGMYDSPTVSKKTKAKVEQIYQTEGVAKIYQLLGKVDPTRQGQLHPNDHYRIVRAYEHYIETGKPFSDEKLKKEESDPYDFSAIENTNWELNHIYLHLPKDQHWKIMLSRTQQMIKQGLVKEVQSLLEGDFTGNEKPLASIGYKESLDFLNEEIASEEELIEKIYIATRRLAKSQKTFFNKITPKHTFHPIDDAEEIVNNCQAFLESFC